ncbi:hypothetical protein [Mycoplasma buteonis]|uniref:hypothetical protein n=1 Tax=Mycoplasma buteonis TaxID=171280 RepID=UPI000568125F|nr:hypothetical protein [Mycoplasma buteonis]
MSKFKSKILLGTSIVAPFLALSAACGVTKNQGDETPEVPEKDTSTTATSSTFFTANREYKNSDNLIKSYLNEDITPVYATQSTPEDKVIVIAIDGAQKNMYHNAFYLFMQTDSFKQGYRIRVVEKPVFDAINIIQTIGFNDSKQVADLIYAPSDRVTELAQWNAVLDIEKFDPTVLTALKDSVHLTNLELKDIKEYGKYTGIKVKEDGIDVESKFLAIRHNQEGIVLASNLSENDARNVLKDTQNNTLEKLVANGKAILYTQNYWYGNGLLGGYFEKLQKENKTENQSVLQLMNKTLYKNEGLPSSGWVKTDPAYKYYGPAISIQARIVWPIYNAIYQMSEEEYKATPWGKNNIDRGALQLALGFDWGQISNNIYGWFGKNALNFTTLGTWELQNAFKNGNVKSVFVVPNGSDSSAYLQAPGSWSFTYNKRNISASPERKEALKNLLLAIYTPEASNAYFKQDTKIPYVGFLQEALKSDVQVATDNENQELLSFAKSLGYDTISLLKEAYNQVGQKLASLADSKVGNGWDASESKTVYSLSPEQATSITPELVTLTNSLLKDTIGIKNAAATMLSHSQAEMSKDVQHWLINKDMFSDAAFKNPEKTEFVDEVAALTDNGIVHVRKFENKIFGVNGDSDAQFLAELEKITTKLFASATKEDGETQLNNFINSYKTSGYEFIKKYAKTPASKEAYDTAFDKHMSYYVNNAIRRSLAQFELTNQIFAKADNTPSEFKLGQVNEKISSADKTSVIGKVFNVVTSKTPLSEGGLGVFRTQEARPGVSNPQYSIIWDTWNELVFGNKVLYEQIASEQAKNKHKLTEQEFINIMTDKLSDQMKLKLTPIPKSDNLAIKWVD